MIRTVLRKYWFNILGTLILCGISFGAGWWTNEIQGDPNEKLLQSAHQVIVSQSLFNQASAAELAYAAVRGMLSATGDPYTELIEPEAAKNFLKIYQGNTGVVGLTTDSQNNKAVITDVHPNSPAEKAGLRTGDVILSVDGIPLDQDEDPSQAGLLIRGAPGTTVRLTIQRNGQVIEYELVRQEQEFVRSEMLPNGIGYITLRAYNPMASKQMQQALEDLLQHKPKGIIWDLRNNEGGDMQAAQEILSCFIQDGLLFRAALPRGRTVEFKAKGRAIAADVPLAVLTDHTTYSAAEASAAAVAETGRGITIGERSFGKGVIQAAIPLPGGSLLRMTVAKWLSPEGEWYHERGVTPLIQISDDPSTSADEILQKAIAVLNSE